MMCVMFKVLPALGTVPLALDLRIVHECWGNSTDPTLNEHLHYPNDLDKPRNETVAEKIRKYLPDYNQNPPNTISFMTAIVSTTGRLHSGFVRRTDLLITSRS